MNGGTEYTITPHMMGVKRLEAKIPLKDGWLLVEVVDDKVTSKIL